jgi:hypothetical protein
MSFLIPARKPVSVTRRRVSSFHQRPRVLAASFGASDRRCLSPVTPIRSSGKWGAGPTGVALVQNGGWTLGILANQNWSYAGERNRPDVNQTFLQPFISYTTKDAWTFTVDTESTFDWVNDQWSVPINFTIGKLVKFGTSP